MAGYDDYERRADRIREENAAENRRADRIREENAAENRRADRIREENAAENRRADRIREESRDEMYETWDNDDALSDEEERSATFYKALRINDIGGALDALGLGMEYRSVRIGAAQPFRGTISESAVDKLRRDLFHHYQELSDARKAGDQQRADRIRAAVNARLLQEWGGIPQKVRKPLKDLFGPL